MYAIQKLYSGEVSVTELVATLARFCNGSPRERRVFQCMVHNLFDEYQFFTKYPDKVRSTHLHPHPNHTKPYPKHI